MKGSIISPLWFYLIDVFGSIRNISHLLFSISLVIFILVIIGYCVIHCLLINISIEYGEDDEDYKKLKVFVVNFRAICKVSIALCICLGILRTIIPSKETMYTMLVANYVTYENVEEATDIIHDSVDYIMDKLNEE